MVGYTVLDPLTRNDAPSPTIGGQSPTHNLYGDWLVDCEIVPNIADFH